MSKWKVKLIFRGVCPWISSIPLRPCVIMNTLSLFFFNFFSVSAPLDYQLVMCDSLRQFPNVDDTTAISLRFYHLSTPFDRNATAQQPFSTNYGNFLSTTTAPATAAAAAAAATIIIERRY